MLIAREVWKYYGATAALRAVSLEVRRGEIHGLVGQNGSGKSTLVKLIAGVEPATSGRIGWQRSGSTQSASWGDDVIGWRRRLHVVHQDFAIAEDLTVADNVCILQPCRGRFGSISRSKETGRAVEVLEGLGLTIEPDSVVRRLDASSRAVIACARALLDVHGDGDVVLLDEISSYLNRQASETLLRRVRTLADAGAAVLLVSHNIGEVVATCDRVSVLRDGELVGTISAQRGEEGKVVDMILGDAGRGEEADVLQRVVRTSVALSAGGLCGGGLAGCDLTVYKGEIVGIAGLVGSGAERLPYVLFGEGVEGGRLEVGGKVVCPVTTAALWAAGVELLPARRLDEAGWGRSSAGENLMLYRQEPRGRNGLRAWINFRREQTRATEVVRGFGVLPPVPTLSLSMLSGGNQQKVLLARRMIRQPRVLLLAEPTAGVDVGARRAIHGYLRSAAAAGSGIVMFSSDLDELCALCDRVVLVVGGRVVGERRGRSLTERELLREIAAVADGHGVVARQRR
jgi:ribose transport system ATP-binding protein